jgi:beta-glucosidase
MLLEILRCPRPGDIAIDQYRRYPEDIRIMREANLNAYRFSLAWPRIQPAGSGTYNRKGFDYYKRLAEPRYRLSVCRVQPQML